MLGVIRLIHIFVVTVFALIQVECYKSIEDRRNHVLRPWLLRIFGICHINLVWDGTPDKRAQLIVANHVSFFDIFPLLLVYPAARLVAKSDVRKIFMVGRLLNRCGALIPVDRGDQGSRMGVRFTIRKAFKAKATIIICPEGRCSFTGVPFRPGSFQEASAAGVRIQGIKITYPRGILEGLGMLWFEQKLHWVVSQGFDLKIRVFTSEVALQDGIATRDLWQTRILGTIEQDF